MAKQAGEIIIVGTIDDLTFYIMDGKGYARRKTSLTGKRVKQDPRFKTTMQSAHRLARGSQLASKVYRSLPREVQVYALYKELKRIAIPGIKEGKSEAEALNLLLQHLGKAGGQKKTSAPVVQPVKPVKLRPVAKCPRVFGAHSSGQVKGHKKPCNEGALPNTTPHQEHNNINRYCVFDISGRTLQPRLC